MTMLTNPPAGTPIRLLGCATHRTSPFRPLTRIRFWRHIPLLVSAAFVSACGSDSNERAPEVLEFAVDGATTIAAGDSATLSFRVDGNPPPDVSLVDGQTGATTTLQGRSGSLGVTPDATTTFVLTASNKAGEASGSATITVVQPPQITSFSLEVPPADGLVAEGDEYRIVWRIEGDYDSVTVDGEPVPAGQGGVVFTASGDTEHVLSVAWFDGQRTIQSEPLGVAVLLRPVILSFEATPTGALAFGTDVQLTWELGGAPPDSIFITEEGGGAVEPTATSYTREHVTNAITHELEVRNGAGTAEAQVRIEVDPASAPDGFLKIHNGRVVVMRVSETEIVNPIDDVVVTETIPQALNSGIYPEAIRDMTMAFYERFDDVFDFLIFLGGIEDTEASVYDDGAYPWYDDQFIFSDDAGLGRRDYSRRELTDYFGSPRGELRGVSFHPHLGDLRNGPSLREVMRHWGLPFIPTLARRSPCVEDTPIDANKRPGGECALGGAHEGFAGFSSNNGQLGGFDRDALTVVEQALGGNAWVDVYSAGNWSLFGAADNSIPYSAWELYAGGMMAASEVTEELWLGQRAVWYRNENGSIRTDPVTGDPLFLTIAPDAPLAAFFNFVRSWGLDLIISRMGMRQPATPDAAQAFIGAVIVVADPEHLPTDEQLDRVASDVSWFSSPAHNGDPLYNFFEATAGRGQLLLESLPQHMLRVARPIERRPTPRPTSLGAPPPLE